MTDRGRLRCRGTIGTSLELTGDFAGLSHFSQWLRRGEAQTLTVETPDEPPSPYEQWFTRIALKLTQGPLVQISAADDVVTIGGSAPKIEILAESIGDFAKDPEALGDHLHISYYPGHYYLVEDSLEMVVSRLS